MVTEKMKNYLFYGSVSIVVLFSFFNHSSLFSPLLNSDDAIVALMIYDFNLPQDLYYWSANRFGSLVPLIGQIFFKGFQFSPVASEAITHYLLLIGGFIGFASLFKSRFTRIIFAIAWFLPPLRMLDVLKLSQGEQYALIGMAVFFINQAYKKPIEIFDLKNLLNLAAATFLFILSVWVSDLGIVTISIILFVFIVTYLKYNRDTFQKEIFKKPELYFIISGLFVGSLFIYYAKSHAVEEQNYYDFFDLKTIAGSFSIFAGTIADLLLFKASEPFTSLYFYFILALLFWVISKYRSIKYSNQNQKWMAVFLLDIVAVFIIIITSQWSFQNGVPRRFFVCNYISFWVAFLITIESLEEIRLKNILKILVLISAIIGGLGTLYNFKYIWPKTLEPTVKVVGEIQKLGQIGVIGEYWNSYIISCTAPDMIKATPNDQSAVRKPELVDEVFKQPRIFIIKDMWLDTFPDTLLQFNRKLKRVGDQFFLGNCCINQYELIK